MLFCCLLQHNVKAYCHKHFVIVSHEQQTIPLIAASNECHKLTTVCMSTVGSGIALQVFVCASEPPPYLHLATSEM